MRLARNIFMCVGVAALWGATLYAIWGFDEHVGPVVSRFVRILTPSTSGVMTTSVVERIVVNTLPAFVLSVPLVLLVESTRPLAWALFFGLILGTLVALHLFEVPRQLLDPS